MGYVDFLSSGAVLAHSPSETARFGLSTDRITIGVRAATSAENPDSLGPLLSDLLSRSTAKIKIVRFPSESITLFRSLGGIQGTVLPAGSLLYWDIPANREIPSQYSDSTRVLQPSGNGSELEAVIAVINDSFGGYINHYSVNPLIPQGVVKDGYSEWARRTLSDEDNRVFTAVSDGGAVVGAAVVSTSGGVWEVELASIVHSAQRQGHYLRLMNQVITESRMNGASKLVISTQSHNVGVQRAWARLGLSPALSIETVHVI